MQRCAGLVGILVLGMTACGGAPQQASEELELGPALVASRVLARGPVGTRPELELYRAQDIEAAGGLLVLADNGNDRLIALERDLSFAWSSGRSGEGPGEFEFPIAVRPFRDSIVAVDYGNGRFSILDRQGNFGRTVNAPHAVTSFGVRSDGVIVMPGRLASHFGYLVGRQPAAEPFAARDTALPDGPAATRPAPSLAVTAGDTVHIFDETDLRLYKFDPEGRLVLRRSLPKAYADTVRARSARLVESFSNSGMRVISASLIRTLKATPDGRLLLLFRAGLAAGFVIDPHTYAARPIVRPDDTDEWAPLRNAGSAVLEGGRLIVLSADSVYVYDLKEGGS